MGALPLNILMIDSYMLLASEKDFFLYKRFAVSLSSEAAAMKEGEVYGQKMKQFFD